MKGRIVTRTYRDLAEKNLDLAVQNLRAMPTEDVPPEVVAAFSSRAQATATVALVQAVLYLGDTIAQGQRATEE